MGLDMYLFRRKIPQDEEVGYWRKANQIREWFNRHVGVENCREVVLNEDILLLLRHDCMRVLENPDLAREILPTAEGFFFGSLEYDESYFDDLRDTVKTIDNILKTTDFEKEQILYYEWW